MNAEQLRARLEPGRAGPRRDRDVLRTRLAAIVAAAEPGRITHGAELSDLLDRPPTPAAVLVPFVLGPAPGVLLTKRTAHLDKHAGQVSFPGGRIDPDGRRRRGCGAARGAGGDRARSRPGHLLGRIGDFLTGSGFRITPVIGLLPPGLTFVPSPDEVEAVFELPLSVLLDPDAPRLRPREVRGRRRDFWVWPHPEHYIWGATAAILVHLARALRAQG